MLSSFVPELVRSGSLNFVAKVQELNEAGTHPTAAPGGGTATGVEAGGKAVIFQ